jgi:Bacterial regulatory helix-turn-helix protein, lysR family
MRPIRTRNKIKITPAQPGRGAATLPERRAKLHTRGVFDWNDLKYLLAFARNGSMLAAAKALGVNQSTVQRRLAELEEKQSLEITLATKQRASVATLFLFARITTARRQTVTSNDLWRTTTSWYFSIAASLCRATGRLTHTRRRR